MSELKGQAVIQLMRRHKVTIVGLSLRMNITQKRVRQVRAQGVSGDLYVRDWKEAILGQPLNQQTD